MPRLSISTAWEETREIFAREGRLLSTVALALIVLPTAMNSFINPRGVVVPTTPLWMVGLALVAYLIALAGQLALIRLALGPSITVGGAIAHGARRLPIYVAAVLMIVFALLIVLIVIGLALGAMGVQMQKQMTPQMNPAALVAALLFLAIFVFLFVRFVMAAPVASAETAGPLTILRRSWRLTEGQWWPLYRRRNRGGGSRKRRWRGHRFADRQDRADVGACTRAGVDRCGSERGDYGVAGRDARPDLRPAFAELRPSGERAEQRDLRRGVAGQDAEQPRVGETLDCPLVRRETGAAVSCKSRGMIERAGVDVNAGDAVAPGALHRLGEQPLSMTLAR
jgi:hypothetical protein